MRINSKDSILGIPIMEIRHLMRYWGNGRTASFVSTHLNISTARGRELHTYLVDNGFIVRDATYDKKQYYRLTVKGRALALAKASVPVRRSTAEKAVAGLITRAEQINTDPYYLFKVKRILAFGSYLSDIDRLGDVDVAIELVAKERNNDEAFRLQRQRSEQAALEGRHFSSYNYYLEWPRTEVLLYLKSRSRTLSLHSIRDRILEETRTKVLFPIKRPAR